MNKCKCRIQNAEIQCINIDIDYKGKKENHGKLQEYKCERIVHVYVEPFSIEKCILHQQIIFLLDLDNLNRYCLIDDKDNDRQKNNKE